MQLGDRDTMTIGNGGVADPRPQPVRIRARPDGGATRGQFDMRPLAKAQRWKVSIMRCGPIWSPNCASTMFEEWISASGMFSEAPKFASSCTRWPPTSRWPPAG
jgi:hypothetical protein